MAPREASFTYAETLQQLMRLGGMLRPYWRKHLWSLALGVLMTLFGLVPPYITKLLVDEVYVSKDKLLLFTLLCASFVLTMTSATVGAVRNYYSQVVGGQMTNAMQQMFFSHLLNLPISFHDGRRTGEMLARVGDAQASLGTIARLLSTLFSSGLQLLVVPPLLILLNWRLTLLSLIAMPLVTAVSVFAGRYLREYSRASIEVGAEISSRQIEALTHIRTLKLLTAESQMIAELRRSQVEAFRLQLRSGALSGLLNVARAAMNGGATVLFTYYGWTEILAGSLSLGGFLAFTAYLRYLTAPVTSVTSMFADLQRASVSLARMFEYLDERQEDQSDRDTLAVSRGVRIKGQYCLENVTFGYHGGGPVLHGVSMRIEAGAFTALVGTSGSGKSTLLRMLSRLETPSSGRILVDGHDYLSVPIREYRRQLAVLWQETGLFRGTLLDNIAMGAVHVDHSLLDRAITTCQLEELIATLPRGLASPIAEWGTSLSAGQRQRIVLARAIVRNASVAILDEPTSHVDMASEALILKELQQLWRDRTIIIVTHRVQTVATADQICVIDRGLVEGQGTHTALLAGCERYRFLHSENGVGAAERRVPVVLT